MFLPITIGADNLIGKFHRYVGILVPSGFGETVFIKQLYTLKLFLYKLRYNILSLFWKAAIRQHTNVDDMVANTRYNLDGLVLEHVDLLYLVTP